MRSRSTRARSPRSELRHRFALVVLAIAATACSDVLAPEKGALRAARASWANLNEENYSFEFQRSCFCGPDFTRRVAIEVLGGVVRSAVFVETSEPVTDPDLMPTIPDLFAEVQAAIDREAFSIVAEYEPDLGYPISVWIDFIENAADEEMAFNVFSVTFLDVSS